MWGKILKFTANHLTKAEICEALQQCRQRTLDLVADVDFTTLCRQSHSDFSPVGWHLGHIAYTESYWILERMAGMPSPFKEYHTLFRADGLPKRDRENLPSLEVLLDYLTIVREQVLDYLETAPLEKQERLWRWLVQHESQHNETIAFVLQLHFWNASRYPTLTFSPSPSFTPSSEIIEIPAGEFEMGSNAMDAMDNESPAHLVYLDRYFIDRYPVTCGQYREFMNAGGYSNALWWSKEGWKWLEANPVNQPLYWANSADWEDHPVYGVSWYEAEAYANFAEKRLPTQAEWEKAASWDAEVNQKRCYPWGNEPPSPKTCNYDTLVGHTTPVNAYPVGKSAYGCYDMLGNVWEWTADWFGGYTGFKSYPYQGYSQVYFDNKHKVMMGGSWATRPWGLRNSFRNWYHPHIRQILVGFRCAK